MRTVLAGDAVPVYLDPTAAAALSAAREVAREAGLAQRAITAAGAAGCLWLTWTGTAAQGTLLALLEHLGIEARDRDDVAIECGTGADALKGRLRESLATWPEPLQLAKHVQPKQARKFDGLLDDALLDEGIAADRLDVEGAKRVIEAVVGAGRE